ncbi:hypothetical protein JKP75_11530 [Blastococcus sp. TML/M2B]|uniref:hypothetical protein n=1 Tax=Blastococcus sp. TML/M2B TaxID=2798727 RepID=UPI00190CD9FF|nr:hypothetical protein [Blastococcus sp. TML/M2B]MBN1093128.1 hypothetical protein [Blastococcus sp. TML/M2B]
MTRTTPSRPAHEPASVPAGPPLASAITRVEATTAPIELAGVTWQRTTGTVHGVIDPREQVVGLAGLPTDAAGRCTYRAEFEVIAPEGGGDLVLVGRREPRPSRRPGHRGAVRARLGGELADGGGLPARPGHRLPR